MAVPRKECSSIFSVSLPFYFSVWQPLTAQGKLFTGGKSLAFSMQLQPEAGRYE